MSYRIAAALVVVGSSTRIAHADVLPVPTSGTAPTLAIVAGMVFVGAALSAGVVIAGVLWMRKKK